MLGLFISGCTAEKEPAAPDVPAQVNEIAPGLLAEYLDPQDLPDSLELLPPPEEGSAAFSLDLETSRACTC